MYKDTYDLMYYLGSLELSSQGWRTRTYLAALSRVAWQTTTKVEATCKYTGRNWLLSYKLLWAIKVNWKSCAQSEVEGLILWSDISKDIRALSTSTTPVHAEGYKEMSSRKERWPGTAAGASKQ
jgi:hypothetical protein